MEKKKVEIDYKQQRYWIQERYGSSALGFQICLDRIAAMEVEYHQEHTDLELGSMEAYLRHEELGAIAYEKFKATGYRSTRDLSKQMLPYLGKRVEVVDQDGKRRRFTVGKSTGWMPVLLEIKRSSSSGDTIYREYKSVRELEGLQDITYYRRKRVTKMMIENNPKSVEAIHTALRLAAEAVTIALTGYIGPVYLTGSRTAGDCKNVLHSKPGYCWEDGTLIEAASPTPLYCVIRAAGAHIYFEFVETVGVTL